MNDAYEDAHTTSDRLLQHSTPREPTRASRGITDPITDHSAKAHDYTIFKSLLNSLTDLAQSRLIGIISNRKRLVETLPGKSSSIRANSIANKSQTRTVTQQEIATHTYKTRLKHRTVTPHRGNDVLSTPLL